MVERRQGEARVKGGVITPLGEEHVSAERLKDQTKWQRKPALEFAHEIENRFRIFEEFKASRGNRLSDVLEEISQRRELLEYQARQKRMK